MTPDMVNDWDKAVSGLGFSGVLLAAERGEIRYMKAFGLASYERGEPCRTDTGFLVASITKPFTAFGILLLQQQGKLELTDPAAAYLPTLIRDERITIHHLLTHTSGLPDFESLPLFFERFGHVSYPREHIFKLLEDMPLEFAPGTDWSYSNTGYNALGLLIDQVAGMPYEAFIYNQVLEPLGMSNTGFVGSGLPLPGLAEGYSCREGEKVRVPFFEPGNFRASGNLYTTAEDLHKLASALMGISASVVSKDITERMLTRHVWAKNRHYGYGLSLYEKSWGHGGTLPGCRCVWRVYPGRQRTVIMLGNSDAVAAGDLLRILET
ncbi:serine hydrolase domain-containing protein [Paenibacillus silviterrae]|uniref:serine hydrolase domain-containing protein n=1 Tax=Paenibacillus silviterrae TaxID=3242194 RepID=UPI0025431623|nr:serine hydrolase domain-containing protein [Paenibacillus chinjuensis]